MSIGAVVTTGFGRSSSRALLTTGGYSPSFIAPPAPPAVVGGMVKKRRGRYEIEINGQRFVASSVAALEAMVARWRQAQPANDAKPKLTLVKSQPKPREEVVEHHPARTEVTEPLRDGASRPDTATPPTLLHAVPGAVVLLPSHELETATQALTAQAALAQMAQAEAQIRAAQAAEMQRLQMEAEDDDAEAIMAILKALGYG